VTLLDRASLLLDRNLTLGSILERLARVHGGDRTLAEEPDGTRWTYRTAAEAADRWAGAIAAHGIERGDRVVIATPNSYAMFVLCVAVARAGGIAVPVNAQMTHVEVEHVIADAGATLVVRDPRQELDGAQPLGEAAPAPALAAATATADDVAAVFYTSGTTGTPKGVRLTHKALLGQARTAAAWPSRLHRDEAVAGLPIAHIMGFAVVLGLAVAGIPVYNLPRFRPDDALDAIEQRRATIFVGVPAMYRLLLEAGAEDRDLRSIRVWGSGADVMPRDLAQRFRKMGAAATLPLAGASVGRAAFVEGYGMVEVGGAVAAKVTAPWIPEALVPLPGYRFRVDGDELLVRGHAQRDWLPTGDLVRRGPFGMVRFAGRAKDVIKSGGYSVYALEVQTALERHDAVAEAAVVGVPDARMGEKVVAAVQLLPGAAASADELRAWCEERLAAYKVPSEVRILEDLPRTGSDKVRKGGVRDLFAG